MPFSLIFSIIRCERKINMIIVCKKTHSSSSLIIFIKNIRTEDELLTEMKKRRENTEQEENQWKKRLELT